MAPLHQRGTAGSGAPTHHRPRWPGLGRPIALSVGWIFVVIVLGLAGNEGGSTGAPPALYALLGVGLVGAVGSAHRVIRRSGAPTARPLVAALALGFACYVAALAAVTLAIWVIVALS